MRRTPGQESGLDRSEAGIAKPKRYERPGQTANSRRALVRDTYRNDLKSTRDFMKLAERRALEVSPEHSVVIRNCFRLQDLLSERCAVRFEYLLKSKSLDCAIFNTLDEVSERFDKDWGATEEGALKKSNAHYCDICQEIEAIQSKWDPDSLTAPLLAVQQDPQYLAAREAIADRTRELQRRMAPN
jgi:hypothetical protein